MNRTIKAIAFIALSIGCNDPASYPELKGCDIEDTPGIMLFTGEDGTEPVEDGEVVSLTYGFQGGYHVFASVQLEDEPKGSLKLSLNLCQANSVVARGRGQATVTAMNDGYETDTQLVYVLHDYRADQLHGVDGVLSVLAEDESGRRWSKSIAVVPRCCD